MLDHRLSPPSPSSPRVARYAVVREQSPANISFGIAPTPAVGGSYGVRITSKLSNSSPRRPSSLSSTWRTTKRTVHLSAATATASCSLSSSSPSRTKRGGPFRLSLRPIKDLHLLLRRASVTRSLGVRAQGIAQSSNRGAHRGRCAIRGLHAEGIRVAPAPEGKRVGPATD
jgi:hypothetical protein